MQCPDCLRLRHSGDCEPPDPDFAADIGMASYAVSSAVRHFAEQAALYPSLAAKEAEDMRLNIQILNGIVRGRPSMKDAAE